jgi:hypothetical protein
MRTRLQLDHWRSTQRRDAEGFVESEERIRLAKPVVAQSEDGARYLGEGYWLAVARASRGLVRRRDRGSAVELRFLRWGPCLLRFAAPTTTIDDSCVACRYGILGGMLTRSAGGALTLTQIERPDPELTAAVSGFAPRLGRPLYEQLQRRLHLAVSRRYFTALVTEAQP